jgi:endonuclease/exonuclease/phosphatase family metal-dependent hydrolase
MKSHGWRARRALVAVTAALAVVLVALPAVAQAQSRTVTVMTRNLYLGTGLTNVVGQTGLNLVSAVTTDWVNVVRNDFPARANALAAEVAQAKPDLLGLQEVSLWRDQHPADSFVSPAPNATNVVYDYLQILQAALAARGLHYSVAAVSTNADVEAPRFTNPLSPSFDFTDVRLTDRDVILKNDDNTALTVGSGQNGIYAAQFSVGGFQFTRGWTYVDGNIGGDHPFRFFNTHLETEDVPPVQVAQANEALAGPLNTSQPLILVCDCNSAADGSNTATYANLINAGFTDAWVKAEGGGGDSCCQDELLDNATSHLHERIDLNLTRGSGLRWPQSQLLGANRFQTSLAPFWASDHAGVASQIVLK